MFQAVRKLTDKFKYKNSEYAYLFERYKGDEIVALDCEMTSLNIEEAELVSIGAVIIKNNRVMTSQKLDIKLQKPESLCEESIKIHHIRGIDLIGGEALNDALKQLLNFIGNRPIMGYNINYDLRVLNKFIRPKYGFNLPNKSIELAHRYQRELQKSQPDIEPDLRYDTILAKLDVPLVGQRHSAVGDAITTALMYISLINGKLNKR